MKTLIICHKRKSDPGSFYDVLMERQFDLDVRLSYMDDIDDVDPLAHDLAIFMGGPMGVYQADTYPYLYPDLEYIEKRLNSDRPLLGICLGAQMMAKAMGKDVYPGIQGEEIGWHKIKVNEAGMKTPIAHLDEGKTMMYQWHGDTFDLPEEATLLASSDLYENQAFTVGKRALGLQFHPEVTAGVFEFMMALAGVAFPDPAAQVPVLRAQTQKYVGTLQAQTNKFLNEWLDQVLN